VNDIEHIEGVSYAGFGVVKIFFQADRRHPHGERAGHLRLADPAKA